MIITVITLQNGNERTGPLSKRCGRTGLACFTDRRFLNEKLPVEFLAISHKPRMKFTLLSQNSNALISYSFSLVGENAHNCKVRVQKLVE